MKQLAVRRSRSLRLAVLAIAALVVAITGPLLTTSQDAGAEDLDIYYLPWVPNGEVVHGTGPWYGKLSFQNMSDQLCAIRINVGLQGSWIKTAQLSITAGAARTISAGSLAVPKPGAPIRLEAYCPIVASVKMVTPDVNGSPWSDGASVVTGYTGIAHDDVNASLATGTSGWYLPIVQTNSNWNSIIRVANLSEIEAVDARINLYPAGNQLGDDGVVLAIDKKIGLGQIAQIDLLAELGVADWVGFAEVTTSGPAGILVSRLKPGTSTALTNIAIAGDPMSGSGLYHLAAPLLFTAYNGWNTGINLANVSDQTATVSIKYFKTAGEMVNEEQLEMQPRSMTYIYTPGNVQQEGFVGSALIESDVPLAAAIDEVKYETSEGISYIAGAIGQTDAAIPVAFRENPPGGQHDNSGINIHNMNQTESQTVSIQLVGSTGQSILPSPMILAMPPGGNNYVYLPFLDIPEGTVASVRITTEDPQGFVALSNDVNYAVSGDGSVVFLAAGGAGYYRLQSVPQP